MLATPSMLDPTILEDAEMSAMDQALADIEAKNENPANAFRMGPTGLGDPMRRRRAWGLVANIPVDAPKADRIASYMQTAAQYASLADEARNTGSTQMADYYARKTILWLGHVDALEAEGE
jgi:hypothetical protein